MIDRRDGARRRPRRSSPGRHAPPLRRHAPLVAERLEARALLAVSAQLVGDVLTIRSNAANDLITLTAYADSYDVSGTGMTAANFPKASVGSISAVDSAGRPAQALLIGGSSTVVDSLSVSGIEITTLNTGISVTQGKGDVTFAGPVLIGTGRSILIRNTVGAVAFQSTVNGAGSLTFDAPGQLVEFGGKVGDTSPVAALAFFRAGAVVARSAVTVDGRGTTANGITFGQVRGVLLDGAGSSVTRCVSAGIRIDASPGSDWSRTISGFKIGETAVGIDFKYGLNSGGSTTAGFHNWTISNNTISGNSSHGIRLAADGTGRSWTANVTLAQNTLSGNKGDGIRVDGTPEGLVIQKNMLTDNGAASTDAAIRFTDGLGVQRTNVLVRGNSIGGSSAAAPAPAIGVAAKSLPGLRIMGNSFANIARGISLTGDFKRLDAAPVLAQNTLANVGTGIQLAAATRVTADASNTINAARTAGIHAAGLCTGTVIGALSITNPASASDAGPHGVVLDGARAIAISGLKVSGGYDAVRLSAARDASLTGLKISGASAGISATGDCSGTTVASSTVGASSTGVRLVAAVGLKLDDLAVADSVLYGVVASGLCTGTTVAASTVSGGDSYGVGLFAARGLQVEGGTLAGNPTGILAMGDCTGTTLAGLAVTGSSTGAYLNGTAGGIQGLAITGGTWSGNNTALDARGDCAGTSVVGTAFSGNVTGLNLAAATGLAISGAAASQNQTGIEASGICTGTSLTNLTVGGNDVGVECMGATGLTLAAGTITGNAYRGLHVEGDSTGMRIKNCTIKANQVNGVWLDGAAGLMFKGNVVSGNAEHGLFAMSPTLGATIAGSTFADNGAFGVSLSNVRGLTFSGGNVCSGNAGGGLRASEDCTGTTIADSTFTANTIGVELQCSGLAFSGNQVTNNAQQGLTATYISTGTTITGSTFSGNDVGIVLSRATGLTIDGGNKLQGNLRWGLAAYLDCTNTRVSGNTISLNGKSGIVLSDVQGLTVNGGNTITSNSGNGIHVSGTCTGTKVAGNTIASNGNSGLSLAAAQGFTATKNMITGNKQYGLYATGLSTGTKVTGNTISGSPKNVFVTATGGTFQSF